MKSEEVNHEKAAEAEQIITNTYSERFLKEDTHTKSNIETHQKLVLKL